MTRTGPASRKWCALLSAIALAIPVAARPQTTLPTAAQVTAQIGTGWNIGNSLEVPSGETAWGNPAVTQQLVTAVKAAGFNAVRIPCAWDSHADPTTMTIDPAWLARVKQVVDYAVGQGMYVVLNEHWDGGWLEEHPTYSYQTAVNAKQKAYWTQIATYFKAYDQHLLFAGTNEVHADYGTPTAENITVQQSYNQTFVDAVRATGGNNASRTLIVQTYNTNIQHGLSYFRLPTDSAASRLVVEVHYYDPYDYTLNASGSCLYWGAPYPAQSSCTWASESYVDTTFAQVNAKWVAAGVPVIIGEYGVATRSGLDLGSRQYYLKYVNQAAARNGIKTFYWDNGVQGNNGFALFSRSTGAVVDQGALDAVLQGAGVGVTTYRLTFTTSGSGTGLVSVDPAGVICGLGCNAYASGTSATLRATPTGGSTFAGWSGACSGTSPTCVVSMTATRSVTATFNTTVATFALAVTRTGTGGGTVASSPSGLSCSPTCTASFASGTTVTLTATPDATSTFGGWGGACTGTAPTCTVSMTAGRTVTATFNAAGTSAPCANPVTFTGNTSNFNTTGAVCYRTSATINGWGCYNMDGRTITVSGTTRTCGQMPLTRAADGYTSFAVTAGTYPWAGIFTW